MDLVIDGYNLMGSEQGLSGALERKRLWLIQQLSRYQKRKGFNVTIVFDGWRSGSVREAVERRDGVVVVYSRLGEKADAVIVRIARSKGGGCVVVTSDREIRGAVEKFDAVAVSAGEFNRILRELDGVDGDWDDACGEGQAGRGRLSKAERRRSEKLKKLRL
ncbi:MAG TPA: NYN domain-containing protein [Methylomirabilota bacterium]|nr:NYN domain-containing protein [Methylomirabilota bacterium]